MNLLKIFCFALSTALLADEPPKKGNFALPSSQQPGAFLCFGENIIDKNQKELLLFMDNIKGIDKHNVDIIPGFLYGITDNFSAFFNVPISASFQQNQTHSDGLEDLYLQLEYAFYNKATKSYQDQVTMVGNFSLPTGSVKKNPNTGFGSIALFLGITLNRTYVDWLIFSSYGAIHTTLHDHTKYGNQYLYQLGFGRNICFLESKHILAWVVEITGNYATKNTIHGTLDPNSGGNVIHITPSIWLSTKKFILQFGVGRPVVQHFFGDQNQGSYLVALNVGLTV